LKHIRGHFTYSNVMSSIAVFLILGGATAFAATKIGANQLKANSVKTGKIFKEAVTAGKIKNGAVTTNKIADEAVTGAKVDESTLGTVPTAENLAPGTTGDAKNLVLAYATVDGASTKVFDSGGKGVTSVTNTGGTFRTVTFKGSFPGVDDINDITMVTNTPDSDAFVVCSGDNDSAAAKANSTEIAVRVFCFTTSTLTARTEPASVMIMGS
jgi:hypothetical protein